MPVKIISKAFPAGIGYDIQVTDQQASLLDYLEALNEYILKGKLTRTRQNTDQCEGCDGCCAERIPLTMVDLYMLQQALQKQGENRTLEQVLRRYAYVKAEGRVVDITLARDEAGRCVFFDPATNKCTIYSFRPLVCQTFICCLASDRARKLREEIVNSGEDQLVKWSLTNIAWDSLFNELWEPDISLEDWEDTPFKNKHSYGEILIKDLCSPDLWQKLLLNPPEEV